ncbi:MAG: hypothetical protein LBB86_06950 [Oscillospiraceae bacterium]|jgi:hypothetical protein|nr:hypothetical protein [Oscillospiraceae bacterium]
MANETQLSALALERAVTDLNDVQAVAATARLVYRQLQELVRLYTSAAVKGYIDEGGWTA